MLEVASSKNIDRAVVQKRPPSASRWHCPPERLDAFSKAGYPAPVPLFKNSARFTRGKHCPQFFIGSAGFSHKQVLAGTVPFEQVALVADIGDVSQRLSS